MLAVVYTCIITIGTSLKNYFSLVVPIVASVGVATINYVLAATGCGSTDTNTPASKAGSSSGGASGGIGRRGTNGH